VALLTLLAWQWDRVGLLLDAARFSAEATELRVPVKGLLVTQLRSTWHAPRSGRRRHEGADFFAPRGTPVVSASEGRVWRVGTDSLGGNVVWVLGEGRSLYYYAHLERQAEGLSTGTPVRRGTTLGLVGNSGNAASTPPHLHFGIYRIHLGGITAIDPVPELVAKVPGDRRAD
jgi:peptidoglycan LD-endopeptidase LytH